MQWEHRAAMGVAFLGLAVACGGRERITVGEGNGSSGGTGAGSGGSSGSPSAGGEGGRLPGGKGGAGMAGTGGVAVSDPCLRDSDCAHGMRCVGPRTIAECVPGDCSVSGECPEGNYCFRGECTPRVGPNQLCDSERECHPDLICAMGACHAPFPPGEPCNVVCQDDRVCLADSDGRPFCVRGETPCRNGNSCGPAHRCDLAAVDGGPPCVPRTRARERCTNEDECEAGFTCKNELCNRREAGDYCETTADCPDELYCKIPRNAVPPHCTQRPKAGEPCEYDPDGNFNPCVRGFRCNSETSLCEPNEPYDCGAACPRGFRCDTQTPGGTCVSRTK